MSKDLKDNPTTAVHTGDRQRMSVAEEEKFKDDLMKQAEGMIKKGEVEQQEDGQWIDNRSGAEFWSFINEASTRQAGQEIKWQSTL